MVMRMSHGIGVIAAPSNKALRLNARRLGASAARPGRLPLSALLVQARSLTGGRQPGEAGFLCGRAAAERLVR
jgi:hypothetical protein